VTLSAAREEARIRSAYAARSRSDRRYSWFNAGHLFLVQERERHVLALLDRHGASQLEAKTILEIGCGTGYWLREFVKWGARPEHITGVELLPDRVAVARELSPARLTIECGSATQLALPDASFDVVLQSTVFSSILDPVVREQVAAEMMRVVKPDGIILWYDFFVDNPWNSDVRGVRKREIGRLFPQRRMSMRRVTLAPPLLHFLAPYSWLGCYLLGKIPWLCTHYVGVIRRP
jgi:ubiquinone/menaquinone biosynthesis C-methylase UbiE